MVQVEAALRSVDGPVTLRELGGLLLTRGVPRSVTRRAVDRHIRAGRVVAGSKGVMRVPPASRPLARAIRRGRRL